MTKILENDREVMEQSFYLPMVLTILERDRLLFEKGYFKLKQPYINLVERTIKKVQKDLSTVKQHMRKNNLKVEKVGGDDTFTNYKFFYKGYEEQHNYFNPRIRNKVNELMEYYLYKRFLPPLS